jgi:hypothetical protein
MVSSLYATSDTLFKITFSNIDGDMFNTALPVKQVKLYLYLINLAPRHEDVWDSVVIAPLFLTSVLDESEWSASRPGPFTAGEAAPDTHWIGGWVGPRTGQDVVE